MRQTTQNRLPISGIIADVIDSWTFGEYEQIQNASKTMARMRVNADGTQDVSVNPDGVGADERLAMRLAVRKLTAQDGTDIPVTDQAISDLDYRDGLALKRAVNDIGKDEKKD